MKLYPFTVSPIARCTGTLHLNHTLYATIKGKAVHGIHGVRKGDRGGYAKSKHHDLPIFAIRALGSATTRTRTVIGRISTRKTRGATGHHQAGDTRSITARATESSRPATGMGIDQRHSVTP